MNSTFPEISNKMIITDFNFYFFGGGGVTGTGSSSGPGLAMALFNFSSVFFASVSNSSAVQENNVVDNRTHVPKRYNVFIFLKFKSWTLARPFRTILNL